MAKRKWVTTFKTISQRLDEGRGTGEGFFYKPWYTTQDVPSRGVCSRLRGLHIGRVHHLLSQLEKKYLLLLEWARVLDIREQYPLLPLKRTMEIARSLGVKHPTDPRSGHPIVMTTDFMITVPSNSGEKLLARTIKQDSQLYSRVLEKFRIEEIFYQEQRIDWKMVLDDDIPTIFVKNVAKVRGCYSLVGKPSLDEKTVNTVAPFLYEALCNDRISLAKTALRQDEQWGLPQGSCLCIIKHMIATHRWSTDMSKDINWSAAVEINNLKMIF